MVPRGKYIGRRLGDPPKDEAEHFMRCPMRNGWVDMRDLGQVFEHEGAAATSARGSRAIGPGAGAIGESGASRAATLGLFSGFALGLPRFI
jgi:hypothetical protein